MQEQRASQPIPAAQAEFPAAAGCRRSGWPARHPEPKSKLTPGRARPLTARVTVADLNRRNYARHPYPAVDRHVHSARFDHLPPLNWIDALGRPGEPPLRRVLVAGCGTGAEAFALRRALPATVIVAVDFSPRAIALARRLQRAARPGRPVRFIVGDLTDTALEEKTGGRFDLISCHGVMSYIPGPQRALAVLAACLAPGGVLYLGVNGAAHPAERLRRWLKQRGVPVDGLRDERRLRTWLRLWDALHAGRATALAAQGASYLSSDVCAAHFNNWSLGRWLDTAGRAGWQPAASWALPALLRQTLEGATHRPLFPADPGTLLTCLDEASPASFHRLLLRRAGRPRGRWNDTAPDRPWALRWTGLYTLRIRPGRRGGQAWAVLRCPTFNLQIDWPLSAREHVAATKLARARDSWSVWPAGWPDTEAARRTVWLWAGFGAVAVRPIEPSPAATIPRRGRAS